MHTYIYRCTKRKLFIEKSVIDTTFHLANSSDVFTTNISRIINDVQTIMDYFVQLAKSIYNISKYLSGIDKLLP